jgi:small subunit ribosomal protein S21
VAEPVTLLAQYTYQAHDATKGGRVSLSEVIIHDDENFERALKRFKKKCEKAGILSDLRKHRHYEKPSERRKRKLNAAIRKNRRSRHI